MNSITNSDLRGISVEQHPWILSTLLGRRAGLLLLIVIILAAIGSRRPDAFTNAQFWAEDGATCYSEAYNGGTLPSLLHPAGGYFQIFPRLVAGASLLLPLAWAPLMINLVAVGVQALPAVLLLTDRVAPLGSLGLRLLMAFLLISVSISPEVHANVSNSPTFLALSAFLVFISDPPTSIPWRIFDVAVVCISGATGPFCLLLLPVAALTYVQYRRPWTKVLLAIECCFGLLQGTAILLFAGSARSPQPLGATAPLLMRILGAQVVLNPILGPTAIVFNSAFSVVVCTAAVAAVLCMLVYVVLKAPFELRLFALFGALLTAAALRKPLVSLTEPQWPVMASIPSAGGRYWLIPALSVLWIYIWMLGSRRPRSIRIAGAVLVAAAVWQGIANWQYFPLADLNFRHYAQEFDRLPPGQSLRIPINPPGWGMTLYKH